MREPYITNSVYWSFAILSSPLLVACGNNIACGEGTHADLGYCVPDSRDTTDGGSADASAADSGAGDGSTGASLDAQSPNPDPGDAGSPLEDSPATSVSIRVLGVFGSSVPKDIPISVAVSGRADMRRVPLDPDRTSWQLAGSATATLTSLGERATIVASSEGSLILTARVETAAGVLYAQHTLDVVGEPISPSLQLVLDAVPANVTGPPPSHVPWGIAGPARNAYDVRVGVGGVVRALTYAHFRVEGRPGTARSYVPPELITLAVTGPARAAAENIIANRTGRVSVTATLTGLALSADGSFEVVAEAPARALVLGGGPAPFIVSERRASEGDPRQNGPSLRLATLSPRGDLKVQLALRHGAPPNDYLEFLTTADFVSRHTDAVGIADFDRDTARWMGPGVVAWTFEADVFVATLLVASEAPSGSGQHLEFTPEVVSLPANSGRCIDLSVYLVSPSSRRPLNELEQLAVLRTDADYFAFPLFPIQSYPETRPATRLCAPTTVRGATLPPDFMASFGYLGSIRGATTVLLAE